MTGERGLRVAVPGVAFTLSVRATCHARRPDQRMARHGRALQRSTGGPKMTETRRFRVVYKNDQQSRDVVANEPDGNGNWRPSK